MKIAKLSLLVGLLALMVAPAFAADSNDKDGATSFDWNGFYIGVRGSLSSADVSHTYDVLTAHAHTFHYSGTGLGGGVVAGFNHQSGNWVFGVEGSLSDPNISGSGLCLDPACPGSGSAPSFSVDFAADVRGRVGYLWNNTLFFGAAGWTGASFKVSDTLQPATVTQWLNGFEIGAGFEAPLTTNATLRGEYVYSSYGAQNFPLVSEPDRLGFTTQSLLASVIWHFR
jgi:outer membrane immunogenic protein